MQGRDGDSASRPKRLNARRRGNWPALALAVAATLPSGAGSQSSSPESTPTNRNPPQGVAPASAGRWTVYAGDTLASLARGIHPRNRARQAQYIAAVRSLNPAVAALAADAPMPAGLQLTLPDLKALSGLPASTITFPVAAAAPRAEPPQAVVREAPAAAPPPEAAKAVPPLPATVPGQWTVRASDTMRKLAQAIYPSSRARQDLYLNELRALNPRLAGVPDGDPLEVDSLLQMPDLKKLSAMPAGPSQPSARDTRASKPATARADRPRAPPTPVLVPAPAQPTPAPAGPTASAPTAPPAAAGTVTPAPAGKVAAPTPPGEGLRLRLSGTDINLSRSRNISENDRRALREKQLLLDADDQLATLLSLRNTVRQLEGRLSELQLKMAAGVNVAADNKPAPSPPAATPAPVPATASPSTPTLATGEARPPAPPASVAAAPALTKPAAPASAPPPAKPAPAEGDWMDTLASGPALAAMGAGLLALLALFGWSRSRRASPAVARQPAVAAAAPAASPASAQPVEDAEYEALLPRPGKAPADLRQFQSTQEMYAAGNGPATQAGADVEADQQSFDVTVKLDGPVDTADSSARFDLDVAPATTVDLLVGVDDKPGEERVRRLQYMYERYPELMTHTVSIDDADSVINAARLYYEEDQRDKACELLTFGVEERPQETRFWLAQFEIFRLENMAAEFTDLASKFHVLFGHTAAWPKVRHIGHELDPANTLFAAAGREALAGEMHFDPVAENWLNAPIDFTSDALMSDLRLALFDDHGVDRPDFESITARLAAGAGPTTGEPS